MPIVINLLIVDFSVCMGQDLNGAPPQLLFPYPELGSGGILSQYSPSNAMEKG